MTSTEQGITVPRGLLEKTQARHPGEAKKLLDKQTAASEAAAKISPTFYEEHAPALVRVPQEPGAARRALDAFVNWLSR
jgi:hypothetical protein